MALILPRLKDIREFQQEFTKHLPTIYQCFTKDLPKIRPYLTFYQGFAKDLPKTYHRFTKSTKHLPKAYQNIFSIYQRFTNNLPKMFGRKYFDRDVLFEFHLKFWNTASIGISS